MAGNESDEPTRRALLLGAALTAPVLIGEQAAAQAGGSAVQPMAPARSGDIAIREEYDAALRSGSREKQRLFVERHSDHPLGRRMARRLRRREPRPR